MNYVDLENYATFKGFFRRKGSIENKIIENVEFDKFNFVDVRNLEKVVFRNCKSKQNQLNFHLGCRIREMTLDKFKCSHVKIYWDSVDIQNLQVIGKGIRFLDAVPVSEGRRRKTTFEEPGLFLDISNAKDLCLNLIGLSSDAVKIDPELHYCLDFSKLSDEEGQYSGQALSSIALRDAIWRLQNHKTHVGVFEKPHLNSKGNQSFDEDFAYLSSQGCLKENIH